MKKIFDSRTRCVKVKEFYNLWDWKSREKFNLTIFWWEIEKFLRTFKIFVAFFQNSKFCYFSTNYWVLLYESPATYFKLPSELVMSPWVPFNNPKFPPKIKSPFNFISFFFFYNKTIEKSKDVIVLVRNNLTWCWTSFLYTHITNKKDS